MKTNKGWSKENLLTGSGVNNEPLKKPVGRKGFPLRGQRAVCPLTLAQTADIWVTFWITAKRTQEVSIQS